MSKRMVGNDKQTRLPLWMRGAGVRSRLLVWYFLLTLCVTLSSVWATFKIFCMSVEQQAGTRLRQEIDQLQRELPPTHAPDFAADLSQALKSVTQQPGQNPHDYHLLVVNGQLQSASPPTLPPVLQANPELIQRWSQPLPANQSFVREGYLIRVVQPLPVPGQSVAIVSIYDATMPLQMGETALGMVVQVTIAMLILFMAIAWITAGRLLSPLRQLTHTAQQITETDLSQRMTVQGTDEIAELTLTFNQMLDRLQAAFTSQQDFIKDVSHELRTPITIIQGHLELLGDDPVERAATIAIVRDELRRMNRFVNDLLLLMRTERPNFLRVTPMEVADLTQELFAKAQGLAPRNWQLEAIGTGELVCDRQRLTQIIMNLAQNATQYTQAGDTIAIGSAIDAEQVRFWVRDTGEGIAVEDQERIFNRFARGAHSERRSDGSGLGLSIVQALVKAHQGHLELWSRLGEGATFTVFLPRQRSEIGIATPLIPVNSVESSRPQTPAIPSQTRL